MSKPTVIFFEKLPGKNDQWERSEEDPEDDEHEIVVIRDTQRVHREIEAKQRQGWKIEDISEPGGVCFRVSKE